MVVAFLVWPNPKGKERESEDEDRDGQGMWRVGLDMR